MKENIDRLATANGVRWYGHVLKRDDNSVLRLLCILKSVGKKARKTEEDLEEASGTVDREDRFEEGGCPESIKVERRSVSNYRRNGVNPAISAKGTILNKNRITTINYYKWSRFNGVYKRK